MPMLDSPRPYAGEADVRAMRAILAAGRQASLPTYYVHPGDLNWWLYYLNASLDRPDTIFLWEAPGATCWAGRCSRPTGGRLTP
jgi:hypothetical protein